MVVQIMSYQITDQILFLRIVEILLLDLQNGNRIYPLAPWYGGFSERLVKSVKDLLIKDLKGSRLSCKEMLTVLFEYEAILNNRSLTYIYLTDLPSCLTPNHLLYGRVIQSSSIQSSPLTHDPSELTAYINQVTTMINRFWDKWKY